MDDVGIILRLISREQLEQEYKVSYYGPHNWLWGEALTLDNCRIDFANPVRQKTAIAFNLDDDNIQLDIVIQEQQFVVIPAADIMMRVKKR